jgi:PP-loop superfamily ATP-utilizing enzyme
MKILETKLGRINTAKKLQKELAKLERMPRSENNYSLVERVVS